MTPSLTNAGKPDDITQEAWDAGMKEARFYADWLHAGNSSGSVSPHAVTALADTIARAIMAAAAAEREACEKVCDDEIGQAKKFGPHHVPIIASVRAAIRKRGEG